ncbi:MAG: hypothetical protein JO053_02695 [Acidobacteria bacterium]|nr:hypothetical protein [Acidobacteriota bacterium]
MKTLIFCILMLLVSCGAAVSQPVSQTSTVPGSIDPTGTWLIYQNDGSLVTGSLIFVRQRGDIIDIISDTADGTAAENRTAYIRNGRLIYFDAPGGSAAIDATGSRMDWSNGTKWVRQSKSLPDAFAVRHSDKWPSPPAKPTVKPAVTPTPTPTPTPPEKVLPDITGTYTIYKANGLVDAGVGSVFYETGVLTFKVTEGRAFRKATSFVNNGVISTGWSTTGTVSNDGKTITWSDKTKWVRRP